MKYLDIENEAESSFQAKKNQIHFGNHLDAFLQIVPSISGSIDKKKVLVVFIELFRPKIMPKPISFVPGKGNMSDEGNLCPHYMKYDLSDLNDTNY